MIGDREAYPEVDELMDESERRWMVAYTKMHHERKVIDRLKTIHGIECFAPITRELRQWSDRKKLSERLVISMTIFTKVNEHERIQVLQDPSVSGYMMDRMHRCPVTIPDNQIEDFRQMLSAGEGPLTLNPHLLAQGDMVEVMEGPLAGIVGQFASYKGKGLLSIHIEALGYATMEISADQVKLI